MEDIKFISTESIDNLSVLNIYIGKDKKSSIEYLSKHFNVTEYDKSFLIENYNIPNTPYKVSITFCINDINKIGTIRIIGTFLNRHDCESMMLYYENLLPSKLLKQEQKCCENTDKMKEFCGKIIRVEEYISEPQKTGMRYICMLNIRSVYEGINDPLTIKKIAFRVYEPIERHSNFPLFKFNFKVNKSIIIKIALSVLLLIVIYMYVMNNRYIIKPPYRYDKWTNKAEYIHFDRRY